MAFQIQEKLLKIRNSDLWGGNSFQELNERRQKFLTDRTINEMARVGFVTHSISYNGEELSAEISQSRFQDSSQAIDLASRVLANNAPRNIKKITVINIDQGIETLRASVDRQDIVRYVIDSGKGLIIVVNKWDLIDKDTDTMKEFIEEMIYRYPGISHYPILFTSVLENQRLFNLLELSIELDKKRKHKIGTNELNVFIEKFSFQKSAAPTSCK